MLASVIRVEDFCPSHGKKGKASHKRPAFKQGERRLPACEVSGKINISKESAVQNTLKINQSWGSRATHPCLPLGPVRERQTAALLACQNFLCVHSAEIRH